MKHILVLQQTVVVSSYFTMEIALCQPVHCIVIMARTLNNLWFGRKSSHTIKRRKRYTRRAWLPFGQFTRANVLLVFKTVTAYYSYCCGFPRAYAIIILTWSFIHVKYCNTPDDGYNRLGKDIINSTLTVGVK